MSDSIHSRPLSATGRENFDRIFRRTDPVHSLTPGTIRVYYSDCCGAKVMKYFENDRFTCHLCGLPCQLVLTKIN